MIFCIFAVDFVCAKLKREEKFSSRKNILVCERNVKSNKNMLEVDLDNRSDGPKNNSWVSRI